MIYQQARLLTSLQPHNAETFVAGAFGVRLPPVETRVGHLDVARNWRPRVLSNALGSLAVRGAIHEQGLDRNAFAHRAGVYSAIWLAAIFALYFVLMPRGALTAVLATYAGVAFAYLPGIADRVYPWDLPALFFVALFVCLLLRRRLELFLWALPIGVLCKETIGVLVLAYLFVEGSRRRRLRRFGLGLGLVIAARALAGLLTRTPPGALVNPSLLLANLRFLVTGEFPHPEWYLWIPSPVWAFLLDGGLLLGFLLHPYRDANTRMLRVLVLVLALGNLSSGIVFEYRIWFELIPICLYPFVRAADRTSIPEAEPRP